MFDMETLGQPLGCSPRKREVEGFDMGVLEVELKQPELGISEDLTPYEGQWVAVRDGLVVAHDPDPERLREDPEVDPTDTFVAVGSRATSFYLL